MVWYNNNYTINVILLGVGWLRVPSLWKGCCGLKGLWTTELDTIRTVVLRPWKPPEWEQDLEFCSAQGKHGFKRRYSCLVFTSNILLLCFTLTAPLVHILRRCRGNFCCNSMGHHGCKVWSGKKDKTTVIVRDVPIGFFVPTIRFFKYWISAYTEPRSDTCICLDNRATDRFFVYNNNKVTKDLQLNTFIWVQPAFS